jgi:hypothetical protein
MCHIERGTPQIAGQYFALSCPDGNAGRGGHPCRGSRCRQPDRLLTSLFNRYGAAPRVTEEDRRIQAPPLQLIGKIVNATIGAKTVGVEHRQRRPLVLPDDGAQFAAADDRRLRQSLTQQANRPALVYRVQE